MKKEFLLASLSLLFLAGCSSQPGADILAGKTYGDGEISITFSEDGKQYTSNWFSLPLSVDNGTTLTDIDGSRRDVQLESDGSLAVKLLGRSRVLTVQSEPTEGEEGVGGTTYNLLGQSALQLSLNWSTGAFSLGDGLVDGHVFKTEVPDELVFISSDGQSVEYLSYSDDLLYGWPAEDSVEAVSVPLNIMGAEKTVLDSSCSFITGDSFKFSSDGAVDCNGTTESYDVGSDGLVRVKSVLDGATIDSLYLGDGKLYRVVFQKDSWEDYLMSMRQEGEAGLGTLNHFEPESSGNRVFLYTSVLLPSVKDDDARKQSLLDSALVKSEDVEVVNFEDVRSKGLVPIADSVLRDRVISEVGEENMAPENENGEVVIDFTPK